MIFQAIATGALIVLVKILLTVEHHYRSKHWPKEWR